MKKGRSQPASSTESFDMELYFVEMKELKICQASSEGIGTIEDKRQRAAQRSTNPLVFVLPHVVDSTATTTCAQYC